MARLVQLYVAISSCIYASVLTPMIIFFFSSQGDYSKFWIICTFIICNAFFIPMVLFMIFYTIIVGKYILKRQETYFQSFFEFIQSLIVLLLSPLLIVLFAIGGWRFCSFLYFGSTVTVFRDELFVTMWNRIQIWMDHCLDDYDEYNKIICLFYLFNDIGRINGKTIKPIDYYPIHNILPTTKSKNVKYLHSLIDEEFENNNMPLKSLQIEKDLPYNYWTIQFGFKLGKIGEYLYFNDVNYHFIDVYLLNFSIYIGFIFGVIFQYIWMIYLIQMTNKHWSSLILLFMVDLIFGVQYICFIWKNLGKYKYIINFYESRTIQRYLRRQFAFYLRKRKSNINDSYSNHHLHHHRHHHNDYFNMNYTSISQMFTDDIMERLNDCYFFYCHKYETKKELIKYLDVNLCKIVIDYLYDINSVDQTQGGHDVEDVFELIHDEQEQEDQDNDMHIIFV